MINQEYPVRKAEKSINNKRLLLEKLLYQEQMEETYEETDDE